MRFFVVLISIIFYSNLTLSQLVEHTVYFESDQAIFNDSSQLLLFISQIDSAKIVIHGYSDTIGTAIYNNTLSQNRAENVKSFLIDHGVSNGQVIECTGSGEAATFNSNAEGRKVILVAIIPETMKVPVITSAEFIVKNERNTLESVDYKSMDQKKKPEESLELSILALKIGETFPIKNLEFIGGRARLVESSKPVLKSLLDIMKTSPTLKIEIQGHICCDLSQREIGSNAKGIKGLSRSRAKYVYKYLIRNGIEKERLNYKGLGTSKRYVPLDGSKPSSRQNRRVEIMIVGK